MADESQFDSTRSLTTEERRTLSLLFDIKADLCENTLEAASYRRYVEILTCGFTAEYGRIFQEIEPELSPEGCALVKDIFDMFTDLDRSYKALSDEDRATLGKDASWATQFSGFDFNDQVECTLSRYADFLIEDGKWRWLAHHFNDSNEGGNSHCSMLGTYRAMLEAWNRLRRPATKPAVAWGCDLSAAELRTVIDARLLR